MYNRQSKFDRASTPRSRLVNMRKHEQELSPALDSSAETSAPVKVNISKSLVAEPDTQVAEPQNTLDAGKISDDTCNAIMAIQASTDPQTINLEVEKLRKISDQIKSKSNDKALLELSTSIDKFLKIIGRSTKPTNSVEKSSAVKITPKVMRSATKVAKTAPKAVQVQVNQAITQTSAPARATASSQTATPAQSATSSRATTPLQATVAPKITITPKVAKKSVAIRKAPTAAKKHTAPVRVKSDSKISNHAIEKSGSTLQKNITVFRLRKQKINKFRIGVAIATTAASIAVVAGVVCMNMPDISVRVVALQTGIEARYPGYIPKDFNLSGIESEEGKITMIFKDSSSATISLSEEKSSWDSAALLRNFVAPTWEESYITTHEQGITIYISDRSTEAAWVSGGILYKINAIDTNLTKKQIRNIALSL